MAALTESFTPLQVHASVVGDMPSTSGATHAAPPPVYVPEDFVLEPGQLCPIDRVGKGSANDVFRCAGCTRPECQGSRGCAPMAWRFDPAGYLKEILTARVYDVAVETPLDRAPRLSESLGNTVLLKREDMQPVFSFKIRGAYNKMASLTEEELARGVICSSAGNHAQGVALGASRLGTSSVICMPTTTPDIKVSSVRRLGGQVVLEGETYSDTQSYAQQRAQQDGRVFVAPYDDPYVIAGQGTIGNEILRCVRQRQASSRELTRPARPSVPASFGRVSAEAPLIEAESVGWTCRQCPNLDDLHAIFVAIGGGGLVAGIAAYVKALKPDIKVIGVEPTGSNAMAFSLARGERVQLSRVDAFADGVAVKYVGAETYRLCRELVDGVVLVSNSEISAAIKDVFNDTRSILEPAGAVALAGCKSYMQREGLKDKTCVVVTSGANMNFDRLRLVSELADVGARKEAMLATTIPEVSRTRPLLFRCSSSWPIT